MNLNHFKNHCAGEHQELILDTTSHLSDNAKSALMLGKKKQRFAYLVLQYTNQDIWNNLIGVVEILSSVYKEKTVEYTSILHKMVLNGHFKGNLERLPQVLDFLLENSFILQNCHVHTFDFFVTYLSDIDSWIHLPNSVETMLQVLNKHNENRNICHLFSKIDLLVNRHTMLVKLDKILTEANQLDPELKWVNNDVKNTLFMYQSLSTLLNYPEKLNNIPIKSMNQRQMDLWLKLLLNYNETNAKNIAFWAYAAKNNYFFKYFHKDEDIIKEQAKLFVLKEMFNGINAFQKLPLLEQYDIICRIVENEPIKEYSNQVESFIESIV